MSEKVVVMNKKYVKNKVYRRLWLSVPQVVFIILFFLIVGICLGGIVAKYVSLPNAEYGSVADWVSGIGTMTAVVISLWVATGKRSNLSLTFGLEIGKRINNDWRITPRFYNRSDVAVTLSYYGVRKYKKGRIDKLGTFSKIEPLKEDNLEYKKIDKGETISATLRLLDIENELKISNDFQGNIEIGFAEPDGTLYTLIINWSKLLNNFKNMEEKNKSILQTDDKIK